MEKQIQPTKSHNNYLANAGIIILSILLLIMWDAIWQNPHHSIQQFWPLTLVTILNANLISVGLVIFKKQPHLIRDNPFAITALIIGLISIMGSLQLYFQLF